LNGLTGFATLATGIRRIIVIINYNTSIIITNKECINSVSYFIRFTLNSLNGTGLLLVNMDRFIAAVFPLFYFRHQCQIALLLMAIPYAFTIIFAISAFAVTLLLPAHPINILCGLEHILHPSVFTACLALNATTALSSTLVMTGVVFVMRRRINHIAKKHKTIVHGNISAFVRNQNRFTTTMLLSSIFTFVLFVAPTCYQLGTEIFSHDSETLEVIALYLCYINAFNMVCFFVIRQEDIKSRIISLIKKKSLWQLTNKLNVATVFEGSPKVQQSFTKQT
uniref:G-protein coupled receptors family 1 profile domain-containing protein n=1 Tax=Parascaris univalens TaxID=6257 RepID=A0A914ZHD8_PARUN